MTRLLADWTEHTADAVRATTLGQKLLQLVLPGVPDVFQGCESVALTLVDPDNRQAVDHADLAARLTQLDGVGLDGVALDPGGLWLADAQAARDSARRCGCVGTGRPGSSVRQATYAPVATTSGSALALSRGATRTAPA